MTPDAEILAWITEQQRSKQGIYPGHVAMDVAVQFGISRDRAGQLVLEHIRGVLTQAVQAAELASVETGA